MSLYILLMFYEGFHLETNRRVCSTKKSVIFPSLAHLSFFVSLSPQAASEHKVHFLLREGAQVYCDKQSTLCLLCLHASKQHFARINIEASVRRVCREPCLGSEEVFFASIPRNTTVWENDGATVLGDHITCIGE